MIGPLGEIEDLKRSLDMSQIKSSNRQSQPVDKQALMEQIMAARRKVDDMIEIIA